MVIGALTLANHTREGGVKKVHVWDHLPRTQTRWDGRPYRITEALQKSVGEPFQGQVEDALTICHTEVPEKLLCVCMCVCVCVCVCVYICK